MQNYDIAIFIDSYDGNADVWDTFFEIQKYYWPDCCFHRYLVTNTMLTQIDNLTVIQTGEDNNWFSMTIKGLGAIKEKYILFLLDDYFISKTISNADILEIIDGMVENNIFYYRLTSPRAFPSGMANLRVPQNTPYPISLQPAIWNKDVFLDYLKELSENGCSTPWDFERFFIDKYKKEYNNYMVDGIRYDSRNIMGYKNGIVQGKWDPRIINFYKRQGIIIDTKKRGLMPFEKVLIDSAKRNKLIRSMSYPVQRKIKNFFKRFGLDFMTD